MSDIISCFKKIYRGRKKELMNELSQYLKKKTKKFIVTANTEIIVSAGKDDTVSNLLLDNDNLIVCDGIRLCKAIKKYEKLNVNIIPGVEITKELLKVAHDKKYCVYIYGSSPKTIELLKNKIKKSYFNIKLLGIKDGYSFDHKEVMQEIISLSPDIIIIALGVPLQERLIYDNIDKFKKGLFIGVGGSLDVISGVKKRAPKFMINMRLEWLYRIIKEPRRIPKFIKTNIQFLKILRRKTKND